MFNNNKRDKMIEPQHMLVEERGLERQIKKLEQLLNPKHPPYIREQVSEVIRSLEDIKSGIKHENDRILKDQLTNSKQQSKDYKKLSTYNL